MSPRAASVGGLASGSLRFESLCTLRSSAVSFSDVDLEVGPPTLFKRDRMGVFFALEVVRIESSATLREMSPDFPCDVPVRLDLELLALV